MVVCVRNYAVTETTWTFVYKEVEICAFVAVKWNGTSLEFCCFLVSYCNKNGIHDWSRPSELRPPIVNAKMVLIRGLVLFLERS